jgi:RNA polymerase sigma-70 factor (ECF subfamily)
MAEGSPAARKPAGVTRLPVNRLSDAELVRAVVRGDREAGGLLWDRHAQAVKGALRSALGPDQEAEDLTQEVFLRFLRAARTVRDPDAVQSFLVGIAYRVAVSELRRRKVRSVVRLSLGGELPDAGAPDPEPEAREALRALYRLLDRLRVRDRMAFVMRHIRGMPLPDVAQALGISEATAWRAASHAKTRVLALAHTEPALEQYLSTFASEASRNR